MTTTNSPSSGVVSRGRRLAVLCGIAAVAAALITLAFPADAAAWQFNATIRGKVSDADGNALAGVKITITKLAQDPTRPTPPVELESGDDGEYYARNVSLGDTVFVYELEGYERLEETRELRPGPIRLNVTMKKVEVPVEVLRANVANDSYGEAADAFNAGNFPEAVTKSRQALEALADIPDNAEALGYVYALMGAAYMRQSLYADAVIAFTRRLEHHPEEAAAHLDLAQALSEIGDSDGATRHFEAALALDPDDPMTQYNVGVTMVNAGEVAEGITHMEKAIELQPVYPLAYKNIGFAYARTEQYQKAIDAFEKYLEQSPEAEDAAQIRDFIAALKEMIGGGRAAAP